MKKTLYALFAVIALTMSCRKDDMSDYRENTPDSGPKISDEIFEYPICCLGQLDDDDLEAFQTYATALQSGIDPDLAAFLVVDQDDFSGYEEELAEAYENGCIIGIVNPDLSIIDEWLEESTNYPLSVPDEDSCYIYCVCGNASYCGKLPDMYEGVDENSEYLDCKYFFEPLILWANEQLKESEETKAVDTEESVDMPRFKLTTNYVFTACKRIWKIGPGYDPDDKFGMGTITVDLEITPMYCYQEQTSCSMSGDYYDVKARYTVNSTNMFSDHYQKWHGWVRTTYSAFYLSRFDVQTFLENSQGVPVTDIGYLVDKKPVPETTEQTSRYSNTKEWKIDFGITGGFKVGKDTTGSISKGGSVNPNFSFGYSNKTTVSMDYPDLSINNTSSNYSPSWSFRCQNLPHDDGNAPNDISSYCPNIAKSNLSVSAHWLWYYKGTKDWDTRSLGKIRTKVLVEYDGIGTDSSVRYTRTLTESKNTFIYTATTPGDELLAPNRIPFGTLSVENTFEHGVMMDSLAVLKDGRTVASNRSTKKPGEKYEFNLPPGEYDITFKAGETAVKSKKYESSRAISLKMRTSQTDIHSLSSSYDFTEAE